MKTIAFKDPVALIPAGATLMIGGIIDAGIPELPMGEPEISIGETA